MGVVTLTVIDINHLVMDVGDIAREHGWEDEPRTVGDRIALMHAELSEALEEHRNGHLPNEIYYGENGKPEGIPIELADTVIRIMHFCDEEGIDLKNALIQKISYNRTRPYRHGNKKL